MQSGCDVCPFVRLSVSHTVIIDQKPIVTWVLPVGDNGGVFLNAHGHGFEEIYELHFGPWLSTPNFTTNLPKKPTSGQFQ